MTANIGTQRDIDEQTLSQRAPCQNGPKQPTKATFTIGQNSIDTSIFKSNVNKQAVQGQ